MRALLATLAVGVVLGLAPAARAQTSQFFPSGSPGAFFPGVPLVGFGASGPLVNTPINTSATVAPITSAGNTGFLPGLFPGTGTTGFLQNFFHGFTLPSWPPKVATSPYPPVSAFPSTHYPNAFQPLPPITH
jgi:hypothetical protein